MVTVPVKGDSPSSLVQRAWNTAIQETYAGQLGMYIELLGSAFELDGSNLAGGIEQSIGWSELPGELTNAVSFDAARALCDGPSRGTEFRARLLFQNEYCEYAVVSRIDP